MTGVHKSEHSFDQDTLVMSIDNNAEYTFRMIKNTGSSNMKQHLMNSISN